MRLNLNTLQELVGTEVLAGNNEVLIGLENLHGG